MLRTRPLEGALGVHVDGIDLSQPADAGTMRALAELLYRHHVLVIGDQHLETASYLAFVGAGACRSSSCARTSASTGRRK